MSNDEFDPDKLAELLRQVDEAAERDEELAGPRCPTPIADGVLADMAPAIPRQRSWPEGVR